MSAASPGDARKGARKTAERVHTLFNPPATAATEGMAPWRRRLNHVVFWADTPAGRRFDVFLLWLILVSVAAVMLESVESINARIGPTLRAVEWTLTVVFTVEYVVRLICVRRAVGYATSFFGVVDLLSVVPSYLSLFFAGTQALVVVRILRVMRVFRLFALSPLVGQAEVLTTALLRSRAKVAVFLVAVATIVVIVGATMYLVEGRPAGFTSIPRSMYWAVVTITTVGYGDIAPRTALGQGIATALMLLGYAIIAVPTGIVSVELAQASRDVGGLGRTCEQCGVHGHDDDAACCKHCGARL